MERTAPKGFIDQVLWPEFSELDHALQVYLHEATLRVIRQEIYSDTSEAQEVPEALAAELTAEIRRRRGSMKRGLVPEQKLGDPTMAGDAATTGRATLFASFS